MRHTVGNNARSRTFPGSPQSTYRDGGSRALRPSYRRTHAKLETIGPGASWATISLFPRFHRCRAPGRKAPRSATAKVGREGLRDSWRARWEKASMGRPVVIRFAEPLQLIAAESELPA